MLQHGEEDFIRPLEKGALKELLKHYEVYVISAVGKKRRRFTEGQLDRLLAPVRAAFPNLLSWTTTVGPPGKVSLALERGCGSIVDENTSICQEAAAQNMLVYPIITKHHNHTWWAGRKFTNFASVVDYLVKGPDSDH